MAREELRAQVAEALGWTWRKPPNAPCRILVAPGDESWGSSWPPAIGSEQICKDGYRDVPRYDTDWSATGPLIEAHLRDLILTDRSRNLEPLPGKMQAFVPGDPLEGWGDTYLIAICNLLLARAAAGKLKAA